MAPSHARRSATGQETRHARTPIECRFPAPPRLHAHIVPPHARARRHAPDRRASRPPRGAVRARGSACRGTRGRSRARRLRRQRDDRARWGGWHVQRVVRWPRRQRRDLSAPHYRLGHRRPGLARARTAGVCRPRTAQRITHGPLRLQRRDRRVVRSALARDRHGHLRAARLERRGDAMDHRRRADRLRPDRCTRRGGRRSRRTPARVDQMGRVRSRRVRHTRERHRRRRDGLDRFRHTRVRTHGRSELADDRERRGERRHRHVAGRAHV
jgi:hypothetical protein